MLKYATDNGYDRIAWNNGELAQKYAAGGAEKVGIRKWYDETLPNMMAKMLKKEGGRFDPMPMSVEGTEHIVPSFLIPQGTKKRIANRGQPLLNLAPWMVGGGLGATAASQEVR